MPSCAAFSLAFVLVAATRALPVDDISRNDIGATAASVESRVAGGAVSAATNGCKSPLAECTFSEASGTSLLKLIPENAGDSALPGASSGKALLNLIGGTTNSTSQVPVGSFSVAGGEEPKVSAADSHPILIEMDSDYLAQRGDAPSKNGSGLVK